MKIYLAFGSVLSGMVCYGQDFIATPDEIDQYIHVPSPAWEDQIIYFIITDLFEDGDTTN